VRFQLLSPARGMKKDDPATNMELPDQSPAERVPLFGTWRRAYAIAIGFFAIEIALLYVFTHYFS